MYNVYNLQYQQLAFLKRAFPEIKKIYIDPDDGLIADLENGSLICVTGDREHNTYDSGLNDEFHGLSFGDSVGKKTIYDAIKSQIMNDDDFVDNLIATDCDCVTNY